MGELSRRDVIRGAALAGVAVPAALQAAAPKAASLADAELHWLDGAAPGFHEGQVWGVPWPRGTRKKDASFSLGDIPVESWPLATWPDGSLKWSAHATPAGAGREGLRLKPGRPAAHPQPIRVTESASHIEVRSGPLTWSIPKRGETIIASARHGSRETLKDVALVALAQDRPGEEDGPAAARTRYVGRVERATVEQSGPIRAVVKLEGKHGGGGRDWLPFVVRLRFHAGSEAVSLVHSFIFDGDEHRDFLCGLGLEGTVPMTDPLHDRHIRFGGEEGGLWAEAVRTLTGLRRDPGEAFRRAQIEGRRTPALDTMPRQVRDRLELIPAWGDFTLGQPNADGFSIAKRTKAGHGWIDATAGRRAPGLGYVGGASGGVAFAMADFWQRHPVRLDIRDAHTDAARFAVWLWSPDAPPMDLRFYHDGMGMETHAQENQGLEITYEDYEKGWGTPYGIARTNLLTLWALPATPARERLAQIAAGVAKPPRLMATPARLHAAGVLGDWSLPDRSTPTRARIEDQNDYLLRFYMDEADRRRWYGFWNHGDVMHSYDLDRHEWKYDVGGFAWANSELSPDLWLWYSFLRSGRGDVFRFAEAMTRHTGEVDVHHIGRFRGLGTRHGVQHWADSSKQPRVSTAAYRRIYYYLTADERVGDLMRDLLTSDETLATVHISRKVGARAPDAMPPGNAAPPRVALPPGQTDLSFGTSWANLAAAWMTEWERTGDRRWRDRIVAGMDTIAALPRQWLAGSAAYDTRTGRFVSGGDRVSLSHLNAVFGAVETHSELLQLIDHPAYRKAWLDYCVLYNAPDDEFRARTGTAPRGRNLREGHSRLTAYAARQLGDPALARRAWHEFFGGQAGLGLGIPEQERQITGAATIRPMVEAPRVSTNGASQWGLAAIQNLALVGSDVEAAFASAPVEEKRGRPGAD